MSGIGKALRNSFFAGLLVVMPLAASVLTLMWAFVFLTDWVLPAALRDRLLTPLYRLIALVGVVLLITALGWVMRWMVGKRLVLFGERLIGGVPLWNKTYEFLKNVSETLWGGERPLFQRVVVVECPRPGIYTIAFATGTAGGEVSGKSGRQLVSVFLPTPPNPTTGYLALFPREQVWELEMGVADAMKMSFSGGALVPPFPSPARAAGESPP